MIRTAHRVLRMTTGLVCLAASSAVLAGTNLYPDPSFEVTGVPGVARSGERAGYLKVGALNHWGSIGGSITVEPFARYRVTEWVKARVSQGTFFGPYCYEWDNYEWAFARAHPIGTCEEWTQTQVSFISPHATMLVHPLAYIDAADSEAWVDDIVVEKVAEPAQAMAELEAMPERADDENQILARWYVKLGRLDAAAALFDEVKGDLAKTDIACLLAQHTPDLGVRRPWVVRMVAFGGPTFHDGMQRFEEIAQGFSREQRLAIAADAVRLNPGSDRAARSFRLIAERSAPAGDSIATVAEREGQISRIRPALRAVLADLPAESPAAREVQSVMSDLDQAEGELASRKAALGHATVSIDGKPVTAATHAIVIPDEATVTEYRAARELKYHLELITGECLPLWYERDVGERTPLVVGKCDLIGKLGTTVDFEGLGLEGIHIKTVGPALILAGNQRGVLYATYTFLEDYLGCRWFTPDCATWPTEGAIRVPEIDRRYLPPLEYRGGDYPVARPGDFASRLRLNGANHQMDEHQGGRVGVHSLAHTFAALVPPEKYFAQHPEYFSLVNGKRQSGYAQLCLTNPEVLQLCIQGVRDWIAQYPDHKVFSVSQNDTANYCECDNCRAVAGEEGSQAGPVLRFVNAIADAIRDDYPDVAIETLAYTYTRKPPRITRPRPNVIICLCSIECCFIHPLESDPFNRTFVDDIRGWNEICQRLWIWDYIINYAHSICPFPNLYVLKPNINFFIENGVRGIYEESCYFTRGSELQELRNYIIAKTLWDPSYDTDRAIDEFCAAYYGPAAPHLRAYINLIHRSTQQDPRLHVTIYTHPRSYITPEMIAEARRLFDQAEAAVSHDPLLLHRVQVARLPILYAEITLATSGTWVERGDTLVQEGGTDVSALADRFEQIARAEGVTMVSEGGSLDAWLATIPRQPRELNIERLHNPVLQVSVLPQLGGRIWRLKHLPTGRDLIKLYGQEGAWNPAEGGYEEYSESGYRSPGWNEPFEVVRHDDGTLVLAANLRNGLRLERRLELDPQQPLLKVTSTLSNPSGAARTACLRVHPTFSVTDLQATSVRILGPAGRWRTVSLADPADPLAERDEWLREDDIPAGAWEVVDRAAGLAIRNHFLRAQVGQALLNRSGREARVNLELFSPEVRLEPGQSLTIEHSYEVVSPAAELPG